MAMIARRWRWLGTWVWRAARCGSGVLRGGRVDARAHQQQKIDDENGDEDEAADEDVRAESHDGFVPGKIRRGDVAVLVVAFVVVFGHADKLTLGMRLCAVWRRIFFILNVTAIRLGLGET